MSTVSGPQHPLMPMNPLHHSALDKLQPLRPISTHCLGYCIVRCECWRITFCKLAQDLTIQVPRDHLPVLRIINALHPLLRLGDWDDTFWANPIWGVAGAYLGGNMSDQAATAIVDFLDHRMQTAAYAHYFLRFPLPGARFFMQFVCRKWYADLKAEYAERGATWAAWPAPPQYLELHEVDRRLLMMLDAFAEGGSNMKTPIGDNWSECHGQKLLWYIVASVMELKWGWEATRDLVPGLIVSVHWWITNVHNERTRSGDYTLDDRVRYIERHVSEYKRRGWWYDNWPDGTWHLTGPQ